MTRRLTKELLSFTKGYSHRWWKSPQDQVGGSPESLEWLCIVFISKNPTLTNYSEKKVTPELAQDIFCVKQQPQITAVSVNDNVYQWDVAMKAPIGSVYEGGTFHIICKFPPQYPFNAPTFSFATRIYCPYVSQHGDLACCCCGAWPVHSPQLLVKEYFRVIWFVLKDPAAYLKRLCILSPDIADQLKDNYEAFAITAREWTRKFAL